MKATTKAALAAGAVAALAIAVAVGWNAATIAARVSGGVISGASSASGSVGVARVAPADQPTAQSQQFDAAGAKSSETVGGAVTPDAARQVIRTASVDVRVDDVATAMSALRGKIAASDGQIDSLFYDAGAPAPGPSDSTEAPDGPRGATIVIRVPASKLASLTRALDGLGTITAQSASQQDVTQQAVDMDARLKNLRAAEARLRAMMGEATKVSEMLEVERELSRVRGDIESLQAQKDLLDDQVAMATLTVQLAEPASLVSPTGGAWGLREAFARGVSGAAALVQSTITVVVALSPIALVALLVWAAFRIRRRRRNATATTTL